MQEVQVGGLEIDVNKYLKSNSFQIMKSATKEIKLGNWMEVTGGLATSVMVARTSSLGSSF